jgi:hypothetical protein
LSPDDREEAEHRKGKNKNMKNINQNYVLAAFVACIATLSITVLAGCGGGGGGGNTDGTATTSGNGNTTANGGNNGNGGNLAGNSAYFPTKTAAGANAEWHYSEVGTIYTFSNYYGGTASFNGQTVHKFINDDDISGSYVAITSEGVGAVGSYDVLRSGVLSSETTYSNNWVIRFDLSSGQSREFTRTENKTDKTDPSRNTTGSERYTLTRLPDETITVPAGTFNCIVYRNTTQEVTGKISSESKVGDTTTYWFASGVGFIQSKITDATGTYGNALTSWGPFQRV